MNKSGFPRTNRRRCQQKHGAKVGFQHKIKYKYTKDTAHLLPTKTPPEARCNDGLSNIKLLSDKLRVQIKEKITYTAKKSMSKLHTMQAHHLCETNYVILHACVYAENRIILHNQQPAPHGLVDSACIVKF